MFEITYHTKYKTAEVHGAKVETVLCRSYTQVFQDGKLESYQLYPQDRDIDSLEIKVTDLNWIEIKIVQL